MFEVNHSLFTIIALLKWLPNITNSNLVDLKSGKSTGTTFLSFFYFIVRVHNTESVQVMFELHFEHGSPNS